MYLLLNMTSLGIYVFRGVLARVEVLSFLGCVFLFHLFFHRRRKHWGISTT